MTLVSSILKLSLGLGLGGTFPFPNDLARHVEYLDSSLELRGWEGSISDPLPVVPQAQLWLRFGPVRGAFSFSANFAQGALTHPVYGSVDYSYTETELAATLELIHNFGPIQAFVGPSFAYSRLSADNQGDVSTFSGTFDGLGIGAEVGIGILIPLGKKLKLGAEFYGRYQPGALAGIWFDPQEGMLYESPGPQPGDRRGGFSTTGVGIRIIGGVGF
jgi:hypothetical protein